jgi:Mor family transcriptional regulator
MRKASTQASIHCPIGLFTRQEEQIIGLTREINQAPTAAKKAPWAQELTEAAEALLACESYDEGSTDCRLCRNFSELRRRTAALILKAGHLGR